MRVVVTYLGDEDLVTSGDAHGETIAILVEETGANSENMGLILLLDGSLREEDTGGSLGLGLDALDQDAVQEGGEGLDVAEDRLKDDMLVHCRRNSSDLFQCLGRIAQHFGYLGVRIEGRKHGVKS